MWGRRVNRNRRVAAADGGDDVHQELYFRKADERDSDPIFVQALTTSHPDTVLRRLGIIEQRGVYRRPRYGGLFQENAEVYFDPQHVTWRRGENHERLANAPIFLGTQSLDKQSRTDRTAESIIQIFGNCEELPEVLGADTPDIVAIAQRHIENIAEHHKLTTEAANQVTDEITFSKKHQGMLLAQYLSRAIPTAAKNTNALIVCSPGNSRLAQHIGSGVAANRATRVANSTSGSMQALGITPFAQVVPNGLCRDLTHHVLLRRSRISRRPPCPHVAPKASNYCVECGVEGVKHNAQCRGWAAGQDGTCTTCGLEKHWHVAFNRVARWLSTRIDVNENSSDVDEYLDKLLEDETPDSFEMDQFVSGLVSTLASGLREDLEIIGRGVPKNDAVERAQIPVCVVLFGGDINTSRRYLTQCLVRRYKLLIVDGSGGYADKLWSLKKTIDHAFPNAGDDERRRFTIALDPLTSEILGNADLVKWIKKGTRIEELVRQIEGSLKGDRALLNAWETQATYAYNARIFEIKYYTYTWIILFLGLATTFLTVLQTFFLLNWTVNGETAPPVLPALPDNRGVATWVFWTLAQWMVVFLPLVISALQSVLNKFSFGARWVELHTCAERLLSEIYTYRTASLLYKREEIEKHSRPAGETLGAAATKEDLRVYTSREDLLQQKAREVSDQLLKGACKAVTLVPYRGPLPPKDTFKRGDDGFSSLTPDQYVRCRLRHKVRHYRQSSAWADLLSSSVSLFIAITSAVGTGLAAVAAFSQSSVLAWIPFTTSLSNTAARLLDTFKWEVMQGKQDGCIRDLSSVAVIWASLRTRADLTRNRDLLVLQVESTILDEVDTWAQQMNSSVDRLSQQQQVSTEEKKRTAAIEEANKQQVQQAQQSEALKSIGFGELSLDKLSKILSDPLAAQSETADVHKKIEELRSKLKGADAKTSGAKKSEETQKVLALAQREMEAVDDAAKRRGEVTSVFSKLDFSGLGVADVLPTELLEVLCANEVCQTFVQQLLSITSSTSTTKTSPNSATSNSSSFQASQLQASNVSQLELLTALKTVKSISGGVATSSPRRVLQMAKTMACASFLSRLFSSLQGYERELIRLKAIAKDYDRVEHIVSEFLIFGRTPFIEQFGSLLATLQVFSDPQITAVLAQESQAFTRDLLKQIKVVQNAPVTKLIERVMFLIAQLDLDDLSKKIVGGWKTGFQKLLHDIPLYLLSHRDQLSFLPPSLVPVLSGTSQLQLSFYLSQLISANSSSGIASSWLGEWKEQMPLKLRDWIDGHDDTVAILVSSVGQVQQSDFLQLPRLTLLNKMGLVKTDLGNLLQSSNADIVRLLLSSLKATLSNSFGSSTIDRTADDIRSIDLRRVLTGSNCARFASKVSELKFSDALLNMSKEELLLLFGYPQLAEVFDAVSLGDLQDLFYQFGHSATFGWTQAECGVQMQRQIRALCPDDPIALNGEFICRLTHFAITSYSLGKVDLDMCDDDLIRNTILGRLRQNEDLDAVAKVTAAFTQVLRESAIDIEVGRSFCDALSHSGYGKEDLRKILDGCRSWRVRQIIVTVITRHMFPNVQMTSTFGPVMESHMSSMGSDDAVHEVVDLYSLQHNYTEVVARNTVQDLRELVLDPTATTNLQLSNSMTFDFMQEGKLDEHQEAAMLGYHQAEELAEELLRKFWRTDCTSLDLFLSINNETLLDYMSNVIIELRLTAPRRLFYDLATSCRFFDLRSLFPTLESRVDFVVAVSYVVSREGLINFKDPIFSDADSVECIVMGLHSESSRTLPRGQWRQVTLRSLAEVLEPQGLMLVVTVLHALSEPQLRFLFELVRAALRTCLGRFVEHRIQRFPPNASETLCEVFHFDLALMSLVQAARREGHVFATSLDNLQASKFVLRHEAERFAALSRWITAGGEKAIRQLAQYDNTKYTALFEQLHKALPDREVESQQLDDALLLDNRMVELEKTLPVDM